MVSRHKENISPEIQAEALAMAKKTQKPGQTKEQTKLIALGIQKGIVEYKKRAKSKLRDADKAKKKKIINSNAEYETNTTSKASTYYLPWLLLGLSWIGFISYIFLNN